MSTPAVPDALVDYLAARWQQEARRVDAVLAVMTKRERQLVREAAVMSGVRASMRAGSRERVPPDEDVLRDTISACLSMPDLYPAIARMERRADRRPALTEEGGQ